MLRVAARPSAGRQCAGASDLRFRRVFSDAGAHPTLRFKSFKPVNRFAPFKTLETEHAKNPLRFDTADNIPVFLKCLRYGQ
jgi:hypothetical protein